MPEWLREDFDLDALKLSPERHFVDEGIASVIAEARGERSIETGIIGYEGATCTALGLGDDMSGQTIVMQVPGAARRMEAERFRTLLGEIPAFHDVVLRFTRGFMLQSAQTAVANGCAPLPARLARWLVMLQDRLQTRDIGITHEYIAIMLAVRRAGVSIALKALERDGLIRVNRGSVTLLDRKKLIAMAEGLYGASERHYKRLIGWSPIYAE